MILPAGKGNAAIVLSSEDYNSKLKTALNNPVHSRLTVDLTTRIQRQTSSVIKKSDITEEVADPTHFSATKAAWTAKEQQERCAMETNSRLYFLSHIPAGEPSCGPV
jgi:hypothetical protein